MAERKKRETIPNLESLTMGNCTIVLTLDTRYRDEDGKYHASIRLTQSANRMGVDVAAIRTRTISRKLI